jgi:hypothetical protein
MKFYLISEERLKEVVVEAVTHARHFPSMPAVAHARMALEDLRVLAINPAVTSEENRIERLGVATLAGINKENNA